MSTEIRPGAQAARGERVSSSAQASAPKALQVRSGIVMRSGQAPVGDILARTGLVGVSAIRAAREEGNPDSDPMRHISFLASAELRGRGSPSEGYDKACAYGAALMKKYGLEGPNAGDPSGNPYFQTFSLFSFARQHQSHIAPPRDAIGPNLFQFGFYLDETTSREEHDVLRGRFGHLLPRTGFSGNLSVDALQRAGVKANAVQNVVGIVRGTGPLANEYVVLLAHLDHVGAQGDKIFFGADDNASGSGTLMSTLPQLQALQKAGKLNRSVIVLLTAAEEEGLVGSRYFVKHPLPGIPISAIKGAWNQDMVGRWDEGRMSLGSDSKDNFMAKLAVQANSELGERGFKVVNRDVDKYSSRQDGANFTAAGIPTVFAFEGLSNPKGGGNLNEDYHETTDTVDKIVRDNGGKKPVKFRDLAVKTAELASNVKLA